MRIVMFGTGPFAVPTLQALLASEHAVLRLVTRPIDEPGRRRKTPANPMRDLALASRLPILDPLDVNAPLFIAQLNSLAADLFVVCDYGQILSAECLAAARRGGINLHGSLLPKYRGAAPIHWALYHGETITGVSVIHMTGQLDGGPVLASARLAIATEETAASLEPRLAVLGVEPVESAIRLLETWDGRSPLGQPQDPALATRARRLKKSDGQIDWSRSAVEIVRQIRAFQPWPGVFAHWHRANGPPERWILLQALAIEDDPNASSLPAVQPGFVSRVQSNQLWIQTGRGQLSLEQIQPAGKKPMDVAAFLRGNPVQPGDRLE